MYPSFLSVIKLSKKRKYDTESLGSCGLKDVDGSSRMVFKSVSVARGD